MPEADLLYVVIRGTQHAINAIGALIVALGVAEAAWRFARLRLVGSENVTFGAQRIRERLGLHLLLALDVFIGADLLGTVVHPDWTSVGVLAAIVTIRIVLSLLLTREIEEARRVLQDPAPEE